MKKLLFIFCFVPLVATSGFADFSTKDVQDFLSQYCVKCHGPEKQKGKLRLDTLKVNFDSPDNAQTWVEVMDNLNLEEMPPQDAKLPEAKQRTEVTQWIAKELRAAEERSVGAGGKAQLRRLNRREFSNTIQDLLHMEYLPEEDPADLLPPDATFDGFDKVGSALMLDSSLLSNYYQAARAIAQKAIVDGPPKYPTNLAHFEMEDMAKPGSGFSYVCHGTTICGEHDVRLLVGNTRTMRGLLYPGTQQMFPVKGMYTIRVRASADQGDSKEPVRMFVERQQDRRGRIMEVEVTATRDNPKVYETTLPMVSLVESSGVYMKVGIVNGAKRVQMRQLQQSEKAFSVGMPGFFSFDKKMKELSSKGDHASALRLAARKKSEGWTASGRPGLGLLEPSHFRKLYVDWIEIEGPLYEQWPPKSHKALFFKEEGTKQDLAYAREMFARFLPRAFRRSVTAAEVDAVVGLIERELKQGLPYNDAIRLGLTYVLTSPSFLYISEPDHTDKGRDLNPYELASRLSYFLWSSMPDSQLMDLAKANKLNDPKVLSREVARMLSDSKAKSLVSGFAAQWLRTEEFLEFTPDQKIYREFDPNLRHEMVKESLAFFEEILQKELSVFNFIDSDFLMLNEPLAQFYGIKGVKGEEFRKVKLPADSHRGGLLGQAGMHIRGSDGIRTKPVNRGVYVREVLFNDPPAPPPPNAGEVEPNIEGKRLTVRDRLLQHQQIEACASCHRGIDPYGLALENFDATGSWRDKQNGEDFHERNAPPIIVSGKLPNGKAFENFEQFKALLLDQKDRFRRALSEKLFLYALGRPATVADRSDINFITQSLADNGDTFEAAIQALVQTKAFQAK